MAMNLGSKELKYVNTSRPTLHSRNSLHSVTASDDFYSLSERSAGDDNHSSDEKTTVIRYQTPPEGRPRHSSEAARSYRSGGSNRQLGDSQYLGSSRSNLGSSHGYNNRQLGDSQYLGSSSVLGSSQQHLAVGGRGGSSHSYLPQSQQQQQIQLQQQQHHTEGGRGGSSGAPQVELDPAAFDPSIPFRPSDYHEEEYRYESDGSSSFDEIPQPQPHEEQHPSHRPSPERSYGEGPVQIHATQQPLAHQPSRLSPIEGDSSGTGSAPRSVSSRASPPQVPRKDTPPEQSRVAASYAPAQQFRPLSDESAVLPRQTGYSDDNDRPTTGESGAAPLLAGDDKRSASSTTDNRPTSSDSIVELPSVGPRPVQPNVRFTQQTLEPVDMQPLNTTDMKEWRASKSGISPPTPGNDDTPYIQFAIDQLTRDEETMGRSRNPRGSVDSLGMAPMLPLGGVAQYQIVEEEHGGLLQPEPQPEQPRQSQQQQQQQAITAAAAVTTGDKPRDIPKSLQPGSAIESPFPWGPPSYPLGRPRPFDSGDLVSSPTPVVLPQRSNNHHTGNDRTSHESDSSQGHLVPAQPPLDRFMYPPLTFVPWSLSAAGIACLSAALAVLIGLLIASSVYSARVGGLWNYDGLGTGRYFLAQYLPTILAAVVLVWLLNTQTAVQRVLPFALMAVQVPHHGKDVDVLATVPLYISNYVLPNRALFRRGELLLAYFALSSWLVLFSVPLAASLFHTRYFLDRPDGANPWSWSTIQPIAIVLAALYANMILSLVGLYVRFASRPTGLKWDPVSLADIMVLLRRSHVSPLRPEQMPWQDQIQRLRQQYHGPRFSLTKDVKASGGVFGMGKQQQRHSNPNDGGDGIHTPGNRASLGYWASPSMPGEFFHGIGAARASPTRLEIRGGKPVIRAANDADAAAASNPGSGIGGTTATATAHLPQTSTFESWASAAPHATHPSFLRTRWLALYAFIAAALAIAFVAASYANNALLAGFRPLLATANDATGSFTSFSPSAFLYSFVPALLGTVFALLWLPMDNAARVLAPFVAIARSPRGALAERSLLLSYAADGPLLVLPKALAMGDVGVALGAGMALLGWVLPVLGGGVWSPVYVGRGTPSAGIRIRAEGSGLGALTAIVVVVAVGWVLAALGFKGVMGRGRSRRSDGVLGVLLGRKGSQRQPRRRLGRRDLEKGGMGAGAAAAEDALSLERFLGEADVRVLGGIRDVMGADVLGLRVWKEPRSRADLVGRLVGRGRGRWSWDGEGGVERVDVPALLN